MSPQMRSDGKWLHYLRDFQCRGSIVGAATEVSTFKLTERLDFCLQVFQKWRQQALTERRRSGNLPTNLCLWLGL